MLDDIPALHDAVEGYRAAATAAGIAWPDHPDPPSAQPPDLVHRLFDVNHVAEQLTWLQSQEWHSQRLLPQGGWLLPWPADVRETFNSLHFSIGTPFPWRHQMPLFRFDMILYTFVLTGDHEGEIWRYENDPDAWASVRAATGLAALFTEWTKGIEAGAVFYEPHLRWLQVGRDTHDPFDAILKRTPELDPFAFPVPAWNEPLLRARQRECGVDIDCIDRGADCYEELVNTIDAARASLRT
jgi:hypothetical protein